MEWVFWLLFGVVCAYVLTCDARPALGADDTAECRLGADAELRAAPV